MPRWQTMDESKVGQLSLYECPFSFNTNWFFYVLGIVGIECRKCQCRLHLGVIYSVCDQDTVIDPFTPSSPLQQ